jgi:hypothetical protein
LTRSGRGSGRAPNVAREATCGALRYFVASRTTHVGGAAVSGLRCLIGSLRACTSGMNPFRALPDDALIDVNYSCMSATTIFAGRRQVHHVRGRWCNCRLVG